MFTCLNFKLHGSLFCLDADVKEKTVRKGSLHQGEVSFSYQTEENLNMFPRHLSVRFARLFFISRAIQGSVLLSSCFPYSSAFPLKDAQEQPPQTVTVRAALPIPACSLDHSVIFPSALFIAQALYSNRKGIWVWFHPNLLAVSVVPTVSDSAGLLGSDGARCLSQVIPLSGFYSVLGRVIHSQPWEHFLLHSGLCGFVTSFEIMRLSGELLLG